MTTDKNNTTASLNNYEALANDGFHTWSANTLATARLLAQPATLEDASKALKEAFLAGATWASKNTARVLGEVREILREDD